MNNDRPEGTGGRDDKTGTSQQISGPESRRGRRAAEMGNCTCRFHHECNQNESSRIRLQMEIGNGFFSEALLEGALEARWRCRGPRAGAGRPAGGCAGRSPGCARPCGCAGCGVRRCPGMPRAMARISSHTAGARLWSVRSPICSRMIRQAILSRKMLTNSAAMGSRISQSSPEKRGRADSRRRGDGGKGVGAVVPGVGDQRGTAGGAGHLHRGAEQPFLDDDGQDGRPERIDGGHGQGFAVQGVEDAVDGRPGDPDAHVGQGHADDGGDDGFVFAVAIGVVLVHRLRR